MNKICTSIEQSKKLIELGVDVNTADMYYEEVCNLSKAIIGNYILHNQCMEDKDYKKLSNPVLSPAWSLTALLDVLPKNLDIGRPVLATNYKGYYWVSYFDEYMKEKFTSKIYNNPIDACYELILKLYELKML